MGQIYKITNKINNKIYIGKTVSSINDRFSQHKYDAFHENAKGYNFILHKAMRKYGIENFQVEEVEYIKNDYELEAREKYWIQYFDSILPKGYNMTFGGEGSIKIDYVKVYNLWDSGKCIAQISKELNCSINQLKVILSKYENFSANENYQRTINLNKKQVGQYDKNTNELVRVFDSIKDAADFVSVDRSCISRCCSGKKKSSKGFIWKFIATDKED